MDHFGIKSSYVWKAIKLIDTHLKTFTYLLEVKIGYRCKHCYMFTGNVNFLRNV